MCSAVSVFPRDRYWVVRLVEHGAENEREFLYKAHALAWAEGQRIRLNKAFPAEPDIANQALVQAD